MSEQQHTPGPWSACQKGDCSCGTIFGSDGNTTVGRAYGEGDLDLADQVPTGKMQAANARLFASAPGMLADLQAIAESGPQNFDAEMLRAIARGAIARTTSAALTTAQGREGT